MYKPATVFACACAALAAVGCVSLPARVAEELRAPDERAPDHYRLPDDARAARSHGERL